MADDPMSVEEAIARIADLDRLIVRISNIALDARRLFEVERETLMSYVAARTDVKVGEGG